MRADASLRARAAIRLRTSVRRDITLRGAMRRHVDLDAVDADDFRRRACALRARSGLERSLQAVDGELGEVEGLGVEAAGVVGRFGEADGEGVPVGLRDVEGEDAGARRFEARCATA